jgi:PAS domain S-box-containing protein
MLNKKNVYSLKWKFLSKVSFWENKLNELREKIIKRLVRYGIVTFLIMIVLMSIYSFVLQSLIKNNSILIYCLLAVASTAFVATASIILYYRKDYHKLHQKYEAITTKMVAENKRIIEERYKLNQLWNNALLEASNDAIFIETLDGQIFDCNSAAEDLYGYSRDELMSMHVKDLLPPEEGHRISSIIAEELKQGGFFNLTKNVKKDGTVFPCEISIRLVTIEKESLAVAYVHDISRQKKDEMIIRHNVARYHAIIEAFDGLIYICSQDYKIEYMNQRLIDRTGYDGTGELCYKVLHDIDKRCTWCVNDQVFNGETVRWEICSPKDNRWYHIVNTPLYNQDGTLSKQAVITDIHERKKSDDEIRMLNTELQDSISQLKYANDELESYSYTVSHDLKAPLITIGGYAQILQKKYASVLDDTGKKFLKIISMDVKRLEGLINDLLELSRLRFHSIDKEIIDIRQMVISISEGLFAGNNIIIRDIPQVEADKKLMYQVFLNLISNAVKYSKKKDQPRIEINGWAEGTENVYCIKDNGVGFDPQYSDRVFNAFQRLHSRSEYEGTGIGLNIVQRIMMYHNGKVWAESEPEKGSTFYLALPIAKSNEKPL